MKPIGYIHTDFTEKFGIPRQSGLVSNEAIIELLPEFWQPEAFRGLEDFEYIWLIWEFNKSKRENWSATVKPPKLGGNARMGVFATRSPFRPNNIGLSSVKLKRIEFTQHHGPLIYVEGADLLDSTPIYDIKPYLPYTDSHPDAKSGWSDNITDYKLKVNFPDELLTLLPERIRTAAIELLAEDPRPGYQNEPDRKYGVAFAGFDIRFRVDNGILSVCEVEALSTN